MNIKLPTPPAKKRLVYLDHAAGTAVDARVVKAMAPFWATEFGNPAALYSLGRAAREAVDGARATVATVLHTQPDCITFTSGGTEANNLALYGVLAGLKKPHIVTTAIEHESVRAPLHELVARGANVTYIPVNAQGEIKAGDVMKAIRPDTALVSIMYANNEIGTINPIAEIGRELLKYRRLKNTLWPYFHTDACQAAGVLDVHVERLHVDLLTLNAAKIYGPKGVGALFVRRGVPLSAQIQGGGQQGARRSGTENVPGIVGLARALELAQRGSVKEAARQAKLRDYFWKKIKASISEVEVNGPALESAERLPNNLNVRFSGVEGETLVLYLDAYGIMAATGSACASESGTASHVLAAYGLNQSEIASSVRFTLGKHTTKSEIDYVLKLLPKIITGLRQAKKIS